MPSSDLQSLSLMDPAVQANPYEFYRLLREEAPVHWCPELGLYLVTRFDTIRQVVRDTDSFSSMDTVFNPVRSAVADEVERIRATTYPSVPMLIANDPPLHSQYRKIFVNLLSLKRTRNSRPMVEAVIHQYLDRILAQGQCEFVSEFAIPVPIFVICTLLGVPKADWMRCKAWSDAYIEPLLGSITEAREIECAQLFVERQEYFAAMIEARRAEGEPADDLISGVALARMDDGSLLPMPEALAMIEQFLIAGNESSTRAMTSGLLTLARQPELIAQLREDESKIERFVEEVLRLNAPIQGFFRRVKKDVLLDGVSVPAGAMVMIRWASGNRDEAAFPCAHALDMERRNLRQHLTFGHGIHMCAGAPLARMELEILFREVVRRVRAVSISGGEEALVHAHNGILFMGPSEAPLQFEL